jgi:hypothetical protein
MQWCRNTKSITSEWTSWYDKQWAMTDRDTLMTATQQSDKLNENLVSKIPELTHHYTAKQQARYLKLWKENQQSDKCIILADFTENYSYTLQDDVQGFHCANNQAILHPFSVSIKDQHLQTLSFCIISDCLDQNTSSLYAFQRTLVQDDQKVMQPITDTCSSCQKIYYNESIKKNKKTTVIYSFWNVHHIQWCMLFSACLMQPNEEFLQWSLKCTAQYLVSILPMCVDCGTMLHHYGKLYLKCLYPLIWSV